MLKEILRGNVEGIAILLLTYLIFSKFSIYKKLQDGKSITLKKVFPLFVAILYYLSVYFAIVFQMRHDRQEGNYAASAFMIFFFLYSFWIFVYVPRRKEMNEK